VSLQPSSPRLPVQGPHHRGLVEAVDGGHVTGWVASIPDRGAVLPVGLFFGDRLLSVESAGPPRTGFASAAIGDGRHAFALPITSEQAGAALRGGELSVRVMDGSRFEIGRFALADLGCADPFLRPSLIRSAAEPELDIMLRLLDEPPAIETHTASPLPDPVYNTLFAPDGPSANATTYLRFVLERSGRGGDTDPDLAATLDWYVSSYGADRGGRRIPLSRQQIEFLNQPVAIGNGFELSRLTSRTLSANAFLAEGAGSGDEAWHSAVLYWWSVHQARRLHVEDCLVPDWYVARLRGIRSVWNLPDYPLSVFMEHWLVGNPQLRFLDARSSDDRMILSAILLVKAVERPDFLRYIPRANIDALLRQPDVLNTLFGANSAPTLPALDHGRYARLLKGIGYDMSTDAFSSVTPLGHRLEAARLPRPGNNPPFDVQVIGSLSKSSGLGQAARLSAEILSHTPFSTNAVDFTLDDPANPNPGGLANDGELARSRINLIHINGDALPSVFAYAPDVVTGAWNIGYFSWELDSPPVCDRLAFPLLDEIWVASDYNLAVYSGASGLPVTKVGMCVATLPVPGRRVSRRALEKRFGLDGHEFVFLAAFDSFSFIQRKNPLGALDAFQQAFPDDPDVRFLIKSQNRSRVTDPAQLAVWSRVDARALADPRIVLVDETLPYDTFLQLKQGSDCYVSLHRSEGWGFGMIEAMNLKVPVICTGYSGNMDFCSDGTAWLVDYRLVPVAPGDYIYARDHHRWAEPDIGHAAQQMQAVRADPAARRRRAAAAWQNVRTNFSAEAIAIAYRKRIADILAARPR